MMDRARLSTRSSSVMRRLMAVGFGACLILLSTQASASQVKVRGPWLLVSLASLGTITWRCDTTRHPGLASGLPGLALGFHSFALGQTASVSLRASGRPILTRVIQPGQSIQFPYLQNRTQRLDIAEGGEDGTLRALVTVDFAAPAVSNYCWPYMPPAVNVQLMARR